MSGHLARFLASTVLAAGLASASCSSSDHRVTLNEVHLLQEGSTLTFASGACTSASLPASGSSAELAPRGGDFEVAEGPAGDVFMVRIYSDGELLAARNYDEPTLASGKVDELSVTTHAGDVYRLRYWGGPCSTLGAAMPDH